MHGGHRLSWLGTPASMVRDELENAHRGNQQVSTEESTVDPHTEGGVDDARVDPILLDEPRQGRGDRRIQ